MNWNRIYFILIFFLLTIRASWSQQITIDLGPDKIALNQAFTITITVHNQRITDYSRFPEIKGMVQRGTSSSSSTNFINGQRSSTQSITQNYAPTAEGNYQLNSFRMTVNSQEVTAKGKTITVGPAVQRQRRQNSFSFDPFEDLFGQRNNQPVEYVDVKADAFLSLSSNKPSVYIGEGFTMTLAFYVSKKNQAQMNFYDLNAQLTEIVKKIKPENCWEENFDIEKIAGEPVNINGQAYDRFIIYQAAYYPLNDEPIELPQVGMKFIKYKVAKNPSFYGRNKKEELTTFYSKAKTIEVKQLPYHPLRESVSVGNYGLDERVSKENLQTGESFNYGFTVYGEGNISAIKDLEVTSDANFDMYPPNIRQEINRGNGKVRGKKSFSFYGIPNEPGEFDMSKYFSWIYFNTKKEKYDTLKSEVILKIKGESKKNEYILSNDMGSFYDTMDLQDNTFFSLHEKERMRTMINIVIFAMLGVVVVLMFKK
ncbi:MAG: BatD family protein [Reichenbachiella sp.]